MRKVLLNSVIAMAVSTVSFSGLAAESASLTVTGTISPATCDIALSSATIDLGTISASELQNGANVRPTQNVAVNVACDAATAVAVQTVDNRAASALTNAEVADMDISGTFPDGTILGLGLDSAGNKIGLMMMTLYSSTVDSVSSNAILSSTDKSTWTAHTVSSASGSTLVNNGYFAVGTTAPTAFTTASFNVGTNVILKDADQYPGGEEVAIDGNVTFSVVYL